MPSTRQPHLSVHQSVLAGVRVHSNCPLPGLPADGEWDLEVDVRFVPDDASPAAAGTGPPAGHSFADARVESPAGTSPPEGAYVFPRSTRQRGWIGATGREMIVVESRAEINDRELAVRSVLPFASALQGGIVLHASAVAFADGVHAFVGASGVGKSTLAARLAALGTPRAADDLTPCRIERNIVRVPLPATLVRSGTPSRLRAIHFLARSPHSARVQHAALAPAACITRLLWHGFNDLESRELWTRAFTASADIARRVPAFDLVVPDDGRRIPEIAMTVRDLLHGVSREAPAR